MKAMARPCRLTPRTLLHSSALTLNKQDPTTEPPNPSTHHKQESPASPPRPPTHYKKDMDFLKAADILFSEEQPGRRRKKFGWDFHLWQAFVACLPSVAIYLTAQYARSEIKRMEAERELEEAEKREVEEKRIEESSRSLPGFRTLHERLDKLEEKINDMQSKSVEQSHELQEGKPEKVQKLENIIKGDTVDGEGAKNVPETTMENRPVQKEQQKGCDENSPRALNGKVWDGSLQEKPKERNREPFTAHNGKVHDENLQKSLAERGPNEKSKFFKQHEDESCKKND